MTKSQKTQIVDELIANSNGLWKEKDRELLMNLHGNKLTGLLEQTVVTNEVASAIKQQGKRSRKAVNNAIGGLVTKLTKGKDEENKDEKSNLAANEELVESVTAEHLATPGLKYERVMVGNKAMIKLTKPAKETTNNTQAPQDLDAWLKNAPPQVVALVNNHAKQEKATKERLIARLTANKRNTMSKEFLMSKDVDELKALVGLAGLTDNESEDDLQDYLGASAPVGNARFINNEIDPDEDDDDDVDGTDRTPTRNRAAKPGVPLEIPTINWTEARKEQKARTG